MTPPLLALARVAMAREPTDDRQRQLFGYVMLEAGRLALQDKNMVDARAFLLRAEQLGNAGVSDYHSVDRAMPWQDPYSDPALHAARTAALAG